MNYTKGTWFAKTNKMSNVDEVYCTETGKTIALIIQQTDEDETIANGILIESAPELLACCEDMLRILNLNPTNVNLYQRNKIYAAIQKATNS